MVSIIMTVYNAEKYLSETIESILNQTYQNYEFIIINDLSTDGSLEILRSYEKISKKIQLVSDKKYGRGKALNRALEIAKGDYIANIDADDPSFFNRIKIQREYLLKNPKISLVGTGTQIIDEKGEVIDEIIPLENNYDLRKALGKYNPFNHSSIMFRKSDILSIGGYNENIPAQIDYELWIRIAARYQISNIKEILSKKRIHSTQYFERNILKKNFLKLQKNNIFAIKSLNLPKYYYIYILLNIIYSNIPLRYKRYRTVKYIINYLKYYKIKKKG